MGLPSGDPFLLAVQTKNAIMKTDNFLQKWHPNYSGSNAILQIDILEQHLGLLGDEARPPEAISETDLKWIESLSKGAEKELQALKKRVMEEAKGFKAYLLSKNAATIN